MTFHVSWHQLPTEMKMAIVDAASPSDIKSLSRVNQSTYSASLHALYKNVQLKDFNALTDFLYTVPRSHCRYIRTLSLDLSLSEADTVPVHVITSSVVELVSACVYLQSLSIETAGTLGVDVISCFHELHQLAHLEISNRAEESQPLSERLVVSIAATCPSLQSLYLSGISRSTMHAPELIGSYPFIPLVYNDSDIPSHPFLGTELSLPNLLRIPTLRVLSIRDTHLGDHRWNLVLPTCRLEKVQLGNSLHETEETNSSCTAKLISSLGSASVLDLGISTAVCTELFAESSSTPLPNLRTLKLESYFPADVVVDTLANLCGSKDLEEIVAECCVEELTETCEALQEFLMLRASSSFYPRLRSLEVVISSSTIPTSECEVVDRLEAMQWLESVGVEGKVTVGFRVSEDVSGSAAAATVACHVRPACEGDKEDSMMF